MGVPVVSWSAFLRRLDWRQGEHLTAIGHTGSGKSHAVRLLLPLRGHSVVFGTKPRDATLKAFRRDGWVRYTEWPPEPHDDRVLLWPSVQTIPDDIVNQRRVFADALADVFAQGGWCVYLDELPYIVNTLRLGDYPELLWQQGRSLGVSLVAAAQRPRHVPLLAFSQATHLLLWRASDAADLQRLAEIGGVNTDAVRRIVARLPPYAFLHVNTRNGALQISRAPAPTEVSQ